MLLVTVIVFHIIISLISVQIYRNNDFLQGTPNKRRRKCSKPVTIPDLPDAILRHLFGYLSDPEVYFIMRGVSRRLRQFAEEYVEIGELI